MHTRPNYLLVAMLLLLTLAVTLLYLQSFGLFDPPDVTPVPFQAAAWKRSEPIGKHRTVRSQMVGNLMRSKLLDGLTRAEVERMLGPPVADLRGAGVDESHWHMAYYLGLERNGRYSLDDEFLAIRFDGDGRVVQYRTVVN